MIYWDNAANSVVEKEVIDEYVIATNKYIANPSFQRYERILIFF